MVSTNIQFSTNNELLKALSEARRYEEEISKYMKLLEKAKEVIKEHSPDKLGTYHYRLNSKIRATDYVTYKYMFNVKKFKKYSLVGVTAVNAFKKGNKEALDFFLSCGAVLETLKKS